MKKHGKIYVFRDSIFGLRAVHFADQDECSNVHENENKANFIFEHVYRTF